MWPCSQTKLVDQEGVGGPCISKLLNSLRSSKGFMHSVFNALVDLMLEGRADKLL